MNKGLPNCSCSGSLKRAIEKKKATIAGPTLGLVAQNLPLVAEKSHLKLFSFLPQVLEAL
jgi:hypothetical protein